MSGSGPNQNISSSVASTAADSSSSKRLSKDVGWDYVRPYLPHNNDKWECLLCQHRNSGGVYRVKNHIAQITGDCTPCPKATKEDIAKCKNALDEIRKKKEEKKKQDSELREEVTIIEEEGEEEELVGTKKRPHSLLGPMDNWVTEINPEKRTRQQNISDAMWKERGARVDQYLARWVYEVGIPFNAVDCDSFKQFCCAVGQYGQGYQPPSQYKLREPLLMAEVERTKMLLKPQEEEWASTGCSIMTDAWSDRKRRAIMNLCVNCRQGTMFLSSMETLKDSHTGQYIFEYVDKKIEEVGPQNVVQVVTDNATNNMAVANLLKEKRPCIYWTSCGTHTINLMLEGIGKLPKFKATIERAKAFTIFIYAHHKTLAMMRKATKKSDIVRPGVTRFATAFLTLQSLMEKKEALRKMVATTEWENAKITKTTKGKAAYATVVNPQFWTGVSLCLKVFAPLVKVLRLVDGEKPSMGFVCGEMKRAEKDIMEAFNGKKSLYKPVLDVIAEKGKSRLHSALHLTGWLLNPFYLYKDLSIRDDQDVSDALMDCVEKFYPDDVDVQDQIINKEFHKYTNKEGAFARAVDVRGCDATHVKLDNFDPGKL